MELHEDILEHFEHLLRCIYAEDISTAIGLCVVADKYNILKIYEPTAESVKDVLLN
jgi:hypothetical protein